MGFMFEASNHVTTSGGDAVETVMKVFSDKKCQTPISTSFDDTRQYSGMCEASLMHDVGFHEAETMQVEYSKRSKLRAKDIKADHAVAMGG